ncbi:hypothetical protein [Leptospira borgpetersenii]|uniref:hypothetical protein n=1 Tax=Leptospira borgpetersenii TaxID=174 RepID=UPI000349A283|nr:hypothetical protein [Leptospira borgpetersenii]MBE8349989.1 hypothetical protein [Leptospira borgpetersenii serovar Hardjo-bovis]MBE8370048.1 hypothetical protein [Leptospira borgpetersenii serovar Hardjo-bovis]MBE8373090.1 hypothetical protein [Leptospira borgpetersenii serovar Hardjo-bovis]MBE8376315.1 hypothetical protein [Leptospira borgpetersenii serovar Hardjo-bovis]MBE8379282.1 hypothetical protein [Leptospira borgpetersenii serovar Hardjo-bovis]
MQFISAESKRFAEKQPSVAHHATIAPAAKRVRKHRGGLPSLPDWANIESG